MSEFNMYCVYERTRCGMDQGLVIRNEDNSIRIRMHGRYVDALLRFAQFLFPEKEPVTEGDKKIKKIWHGEHTNES